jgi:vancomycin resistance protein VanJ
VIIDTTVDRLVRGAQQPSRRWPVRHPILMAASVLYLVVLLAMWGVLHWLGDRWWVATLLLFSPRWPLVLPLPLIAAVAIWRRAWAHATWGVAALLLLAFPILGVRLNLPTHGSRSPTLRLLSLNVHRSKVDPGGLYALIAREKPDVVALQDWSEANDPVFAPDDGETSVWHRRREGELFVASRFPIGNVVPLDFPDSPIGPKFERGSAAGFELLTPDGPVWFVNVHFASPHAGLLTFTEDEGAGLINNADRRWGQSEQTLGFVEQLAGPVVIAGDFNTPDDSPMFREHWSAFTDSFGVLGFGIGYTYIVTHTQLRIDHVLGNADVHFSRFRLGSRIGSPHRPLLVEMSFAPSPRMAEAEISAKSGSPAEADDRSGR